MADDDKFIPDEPFVPDDDAPFIPDEQEKKPLTWSEVPGQALSHAGSSAYNLASNIVQPFIHPIETGKNIANLAQGEMEKAGILSGDEHKQYADALHQFFTNRYGGVENLKNTMATDPFGFLADAGTVLSGGELALARAPGIIGQAGRAAGMVGRGIDPINLAGQTVKGIGQAVSPGIQDASALTKAGVELTPGQTMGGRGKSLEDAATSVPIVGDVIKNARVRATEGFNKAVANKALDEIGDSLSPTTKAGHEAIDEVHQKLSGAYDALVPHLQWVPDKQFTKDIDAIYQGKVSRMTDAQTADFNKILGGMTGMKPPIGGKPSLAPAPMDGRMFKDLESELGYTAKTYKQSPLASEKVVGSALKDVLDAMRSNLERSNPADRAALAQINSGWAMHSLMSDAAGKRATSEGVFMPSDLLSAIKSSDKKFTGSNKSFARGHGLMQSFAETGQRVLPSKLPNSGTTDRALFAAAVGGAPWWATNPYILGAGASLMLPYTRIGKAAIQAAVGTSGSRNAAFQAGRLGQIPPAQQKHGGRVGYAQGGKVGLWANHPLIRRLKARKAKDGNWYASDKNRPGKYMKIELA